MALAPRHLHSETRTRHRRWDSLDVPDVPAHEVAAAEERHREAIVRPAGPAKKGRQDWSVVADELAAKHGHGAVLALLAPLSKALTRLQASREVPLNWISPLVKEDELQAPRSPRTRARQACVVTRGSVAVEEETSHAEGVHRRPRRRAALLWAVPRRSARTPSGTPRPSQARQRTSRR